MPSSIAKKVTRANEGSKAPINTMARASVITPDMIGHTINVHNGKKYIPVKIDAERVGRKLGEFSETKVFGGHSGGDKSTAIKGKAKPKK